MNDLVRPAMYEAYHGVVPVKAPESGAEIAPVDIVGPVCETGDTFAEDRPMPPVDQGDLLAILSAGAYSSAMASRSEEHTSELQSLMRISYAVFCLKKKIKDT